MAESRSIVVAEVDALTVEYLSDLLERHGFRVRIAPPVGDAVRDWVRNYGPDLCLTDIALRGGDPDEGVADVRELSLECPETAVVVRTADASPQRMRAALDAGASGYIHKSRGPVVLIETLRRVADGEVVVEASFVPVPLVEAPVHDEFVSRVDSLTPRQLECLELLADGKGTVAIAEHLGVSVMTIRSHIQSLLGKLGVRSRLEAASVLMRRNAAS